MVLSTTQQVALAFTAVLFTFVVLPRLFGVGGGGNGAKDARYDPRYNRKGPSPGAGRGTPAHMNSPGAQSVENMQNMKKLMEQELKSDKYKSNNNKGYVFTLMPLYAIGVGVFAAYKFLKIKSADDQAQKDKLAKGAKKSVEAENQLNELEQRLAQTERMLNSILTQLDLSPTGLVKSVAHEQKNEIMNQLQTIRFLMKKRGMDCPPLNVQGRIPIIPNPPNVKSQNRPPFLHTERCSYLSLDEFICTCLVSTCAFSNVNTAQTALAFSLSLLLYSSKRGEDRSYQTLPRFPYLNMVT
uniref:Si:ch73-278m9.1 n=1 Tax=Neogobius melanostomus TaxID=47308 RepID=A0A8C6SHA5_9GOBI